MSSRPNALIWLLASLVLLGLDQWSKVWAIHALQSVGSVAVIPGWLNWTLAYNPGAAFSFLDNGQSWPRWLFVILAIGISGFLIRWLWRTPRRDWRTALPLAMIIGGALGNAIDRLHGSVVVDFIHVHYHQWNYPIFNVADCGITVGAVLLLLFGLRSRPGT
ncbi:signal peptidase II [Frateuria aurantia]